MIKYYSLDKKNKPKDLFVSYSDIAMEFETTRNSIAGKFYRARKNNQKFILVNGNKIIQQGSRNNG